MATSDYTKILDVLQSEDVRNVLHDGETLYSLVDITRCFFGAHRAKNRWNEIKRRLIISGDPIVSRIVTVKMPDAANRMFTTDTAPFASCIDIVSEFPLPRPLPVYGDEIIKIPLTRGYWAVIDLADSDFASLKWCSHNPRGDNPYAMRRADKTSGLKSEFLHRVVCERIIGRKLNDNEFVDHIDGNTLNCRRNNLRLATRAQNAQNRGKTKRNTSGYKGVHYAALKKRWIAQIRGNGKYIYLGEYETAESAYAAYCATARELHGEFAKLE